MFACTPEFCNWLYILRIWIYRRFVIGALWNFACKRLAIIIVTAQKGFLLINHFNRCFGYSFLDNCNYSIVRNAFLFWIFHFLEIGH